ncbi:MAG: MerR family transcriptional regulator [Pyrinomonadaceae bacterium]|nr:MerR family transcriptional regulator [Pyrinomonadaceae bacterium]
MAQETTIIPEKLFFKIGEVCELVGVQAHVLRYWESEFPMLSPQKNKSGQRSYRRRDVEIALRIKQLLYKEMFTIAGAIKRLQQEAREGNKPRTAEPVLAPIANVEAVEAPKPVRRSPPSLFDGQMDLEPPLPFAALPGDAELSGHQREALKVLASQLLELREILKSPPGTHA